MYEVKVVVRKGALRFGEIVDNGCVGFIHFTSSSIAFICHRPQGAPCKILLLGFAFEF